MNIQNNNMHFNDFDLFQEQNEYSMKILEEAKSVKESIQKFYKNIEYVNQEIKEYWYFDFDAKISQVSEQTEPGSLKSFTRQYTPVLKVYHNGEPKGVIEFDRKETKIINKYINELFVGDSVSQEYFFDIAKQYFLLDFTFKQINDDISYNNFLQLVEKQIGHFDNFKNVVICINCKLRGRIIPSNLNPNLYSAICHINRLWDNLNTQSKFIIIGNYRNYSRENELIAQLNDKNSGFFSETIANYFQNDFLLLNNMEFMDEDPYTKDWGEHVFSPFLIEEIEGNYQIKDIKDIKEINKQIFLFQKIKEDGLFYKTEIHIPINDLTQESFIQAISISNDLLKLKLQQQQEEKI